MLVGTPPFQANTQEDIYKKVRSRDYGWPPQEKRFIAEEAKDLVASLLVEAGNRLTPDDVVEHDFISSGFFLDEILPEYRYCPPEMPSRAFMEKKLERVKYVELYEQFCRKAGVGRDINGRYWPCVGTDGGKEIISEIQEEDLRGLAPIPGSPSVYKGSRSALAARPGAKIPTFRDVVPATTTTARHQNGFPKTISIPTLPDVYKQPVRPKQSRAAELRELNRPTTAAFPKSIMKDIANRNEMLQAPPQRPATAAATGQGLLESAPRRPSPRDTMGQPENQRPDRPLTRSVTASAALARSCDATATRAAGVARSASAGAVTAKPGREVEPPVRAKVVAKPRLEPLPEMMPKPAGTTRAKVSAKPRSESLAETEPKDVAETKTKTEQMPPADVKTETVAKSRQTPAESDPKPTAGPKRKTAAKPRPGPPTESEAETATEPKTKTAAKLRSNPSAKLESNTAVEPKANTKAKLGFELPAESEQKIAAGPKTKAAAKSRPKHLVEMEPAPTAEVKPGQKARLEGAKAGNEQLSRGRGATAPAPAQDPRNTKVSKAEDLVNGGEATETPHQPQARSRKKQATRLAFKQQTRLVSPRDDAETLPRTRPDKVLKGCITLHTNLRKAMNHERYGEELARVNPQFEGKEPNYVVKWVDYTTKFGIGYILKDGTIGCLFNENRDPPTSVIVRAAERHVTNWASADYADCHQVVPPAGHHIEFLESLGEDGLIRAFVNPREFKVARGEGGIAEKLGPGKDSFDELKRKEVALWRKFANYMSETLGKTEKEKYQKPGVKPIDTIVTFYQRFGDVGVWGFGDGSFQFNFPDHTKILISHDGLQCYFLHLPSRPAHALAKSGTPVSSDVLTGRSVMSYPTHVFFRGQADGKEFGDVMEANRFRSKMTFVRDVIGEWIALGGVGRGFEDPDKELKHWKGPREKRTGKKDPATKLVWVTVGARGGDEPALETSV
ncbi:MAG: Cell cycle serine/threonine-protein kinase cdc5/MSD2 [Trichoglossum hirsutum]|nr:MAG: Cell cycle serine/threonine-protein kinase cdc5/MSD2 [Trichoglossum hirsutum]